MRLVLPFLAAIVMAAIPAGTSLAVVAYSQPFPGGRVGYAYPPVGIRIMTTGGDSIAGAQLVLDGVTYVPRLKGSLLVHVPDTPLATGKHTAELRVSFAGRRQQLQREWEFEVVPGALTALPAGGAPQEAVLDEVNRWRREADLLPVTLDPALTAAASAHARYALRYPTGGLAAHDESSNRDGFTGEKPWQRGAYFGYPFYFYYENMHFLTDHRQAVRAWIDSVYHRIPLTDTGVRDIGYGFARSGRDAVNVLEAATMDPPDAEADLAEPLSRPEAGDILIVTYPIPGQRGIPIAWDGREEPDPYRTFPGARPAGYPITLQFQQTEVSSAKVSEAVLRDREGRPVPVWRLTPDNDPYLAPNVALLPVNDLLPGHRYTVAVAGEVTLRSGEARPFRKEWWFTTAGQAEPVWPATDIRVYLDGEPLASEVPPALKNDRTMVPVRALLEGMGATVSWDGLRYDVLAEFGESRLFLKVGNDRAVVDGREVLLDAAPYIAGDRVLVPLRFVAEAFGLQVQWDGAKRTVRIATPVTGKP